MIIKKIRRRASPTAAAAEFSYMNHLSRYIVRADVDELQTLVRLSDDDYLRDLARYAVAEGREGKALAAGGINLHGAAPADWEVELAALLHRCPDPAGSIDHWVFSWPEGEEPTAAELNRTFAIFIHSQGIARCKAVWGYHGDTGNRHAHLETVRIDPVTGARVTAGDGWDIDAAHRAKAVIEAEFPRWAPEAGSRYLVREGLLIERASNRVIGEAGDPAGWSRRRAKSAATGARPKPDHRAIDAEALAYEDDTGFMSRKRIAMEIAVPIVLAAPSLDAAHAELAEEGIELRRERSGAVFVIDGKQVRASIDRRTSHDAIVARFDQPLSNSSYPVRAIGPRERWPNDPQRLAYYSARRPHDERLAIAIADARSALGANARGEAAGRALKAAATTAAFPPFEAWRQGAAPPDPAEIILGAVGFSQLAGEARSGVAPVPTALAGFHGLALDGRVIYRPIGAPGGRPAFIDLGTKILVRAADDPAAVRASLLLIASRYPDDRIAVTGDRSFQRLVLEVANAERILLDGALGRRQAREADRTRRPPPASPRRDAPLADAAPASMANVGHASIRRVAAERVLVMLGRVFHDGGWLASDYWGSPRGEGAPTQVSKMPRSIDDLVPTPSTASERNEPSSADRAHRAAAIAAAVARSR